MASIAVKYRPQTFEECVGQNSIIKILKRQLELKEFKNCYLFCGPSGCGKTTIARIFANEINQGLGSPIEIDGASNNGVDNVKAIIQEAQERSLFSEYKIYIVDECQMITTQGWNAFLKCIEEPPKYTIFIFCTTDPQKIPKTILNRVMRFNLTRVHTDLIRERLKYVSSCEGYTNYDESCDYISKICNGGVRDSLAMLEKCAGYSTDLCISNVLQALGNFSYNVFFQLTNAIVDGDERTILKTVEDSYNRGEDLKQFASQYLEFLLDLEKYCLFKSINETKLPASLEVVTDTSGRLSPFCVKYATSFDNNLKVFAKMTATTLELSNQLKQDPYPKTTLSIQLLELSRTLG